MRFQDVHAPVYLAEGMTAECSLCKAAVGEPCTYVAGRWDNSAGSWVRPGKHKTGRKFEIPPGAPMTTMVHPARKVVIRARRLEQYRAEQAAERARLRAWWREHGHIFTDLA